MNRKPTISSFKTDQRWFKSSPNYAQPDLKVDSATGLLSSVAVCTVGEAKGHGVSLDQEFIQTIVEQGNALSQGVKCRFGHPMMSSEAMGTYLGRFKNFRVDGNKAIADLQLDEVCKKAPGGDLFTYVSEMAAKNPDMFGASIVFLQGDLYQRDEKGEKVIVDQYSSEGELIKKFAEQPLFIECEDLRGADIVDEPAANEGGLFSSSQFNSGAFAVRITEFLDQNPDIWSFVDKHPDKFKPFLDKYAAYKQNKTTSMSTKKIAVVGRKSTGFFSALAAALIGQKTFETAEATTTDGNNIRIVMQGAEPAVGDEIYVIADDGSEDVAPNGDHTVAGGAYDGYVFSVMDGKINAIVTPDAVASNDNPPVVSQSAKQTAAEAKLKAENDKLKKELAAEKAAFEAYKKKPLAEHTDVVPGEDGTAGGKDRDAQFRNKPWNQPKARKTA